MTNYIFDPTDLLCHHPPVGITILQDQSQVDIMVEPVTDFTVYLRQILVTDIEWYAILGTPNNSQALYRIKSMLEQNIEHWRCSRHQWPKIAIKIWVTDLRLHPTYTSAAKINLYFQGYNTR
jgi:hypothetical protein